jgi:hypothetical protein
MHGTGTGDVTHAALQSSGLVSCDGVERLLGLDVRSIDLLGHTAGLVLAGVSAARALHSDGASRLAVLEVFGGLVRGDRGANLDVVGHNSLMGELGRKHVDTLWVRLLDTHKRVRGLWHAAAGVVAHRWVQKVLVLLAIGPGGAAGASHDCTRLSGGGNHVARVDALVSGHRILVVVTSGRGRLPVKVIITSPGAGHGEAVGVILVLGPLLEGTVDVEQSVVHDLGDCASDAIHGELVADLEVLHELSSLVRGGGGSSGGLGGDLGVLNVVVHVVGTIAGDDTHAVLSTHVEVLVCERWARLVVVLGGGTGFGVEGAKLLAEGGVDGEGGRGVDFGDPARLPAHARNLVDDGVTSHQVLGESDGVLASDGLAGATGEIEATGRWASVRVWVGVERLNLELGRGEEHARERKREGQVSIVANAGHGAGLFCACQVAVDRDTIVHAELCEEASVLVARLVVGGAARVGTLKASVARCARDEASAADTLLDREGLLCEAGGEARVDVQVLVVVNVLDTHIGTATAGGCALDGVAILKLGGELGGVRWPRAIHILLGGVGVRDHARGRNVTDLELQVLEGGGPRRGERGLGVGLHRAHSESALGVGSDLVLGLKLGGELGLVHTHKRLLAVDVTPGLPEIWRRDVASPLKYEVLGQSGSLICTADGCDLLVLATHIDEPVRRHTIL